MRKNVREENVNSRFVQGIHKKWPKMAQNDAISVTTAREIKTTSKIIRHILIELVIVLFFFF